jgi:hypothetical protein
MQALYYYWLCGNSGVAGVVVFVANASGHTAALNSREACNIQHDS